MNNLQLNELKHIAEKTSYAGNDLYFNNSSYTLNDTSAETQLTMKLYNEHYAKKMACQTLPGIADFKEDTPFVNNLSDYNYSTDRIENGWKIKNILQDNWIEINKNSQIKVVSIDKIKRHKNAYPLGILEEVAVIFPREDRSIQKGFYYVNGKEPVDFNESLLRIYWNITSEGAAPLIGAITQTFNHYNIPFLFKCVNQPLLYFRRDSAVLYVELRYYSIVSRLLPKIESTIDSYLHYDVPLFTYPFKKGIGIAENPDVNESFGMNRMAIVASALLRNNNELNDTPSHKLAQIALAFKNKGLDINHPYLNKGSKLTFN